LQTYTAANARPPKKATRRTVRIRLPVGRPARKRLKYEPKAAAASPTVRMIATIQPAFFVRT
jgi:hypothetical protein